MSFHVGQKVVCIFHLPENLRRADAIYPEKGVVYTVRGHAGGTDGKERVLLAEIHNVPMAWRLGFQEFGFNAEAFRPVVERKTDISIFTAMLKPHGVDA
jgi:hypothetical protein